MKDKIAPGGFVDHTIRNRQSQLLGRIRTRSDGQQEAIDANGHKLGTYDPKSDRTTLVTGSFHGTGNQLSTLLPNRWGRRRRRVKLPGGPRPTEESGSPRPAGTTWRPLRPSRVSWGAPRSLRISRTATPPRCRRLVERQPGGELGAHRLAQLGGCEDL